jgi:hypothetical protein
MQQPVIPSQITAYTMLQQFWGFFYQCMSTARRLYLWQLAAAFDMQT